MQDVCRKAGFELCADMSEDQRIKLLAGLCWLGSYALSIVEIPPLRGISKQEARALLPIHTLAEEAFIVADGGREYGPLYWRRVEICSAETAWDWSKDSELPSE
jgi:hypothetical protein